jgi:hypothetical protein
MAVAVFDLNFDPATVDNMLVSRLFWWLNLKARQIRERRKNDG